MSDYRQTDLLGLFTAQEDLSKAPNSSKVGNSPQRSRAVASNIETKVVAPQLQSQLDIFIGQQPDSGSAKITTDCNFSLNCDGGDSHFDHRFSSSFNNEPVADIVYQGCNLGPGTNDDQPSLFDQASQLSPTPPQGVDSQRIINQVLEEYMPKIRAELKKRLLAAEIQLANDSSR